MVRIVFTLFIFCLFLPVCLSVCLSACLSLGIHRRSCAQCVIYGNDAASNFAATENEAPNQRALCVGLYTVLATCISFTCFPWCFSSLVDDLSVSLSAALDLSRRHFALRLRFIASNVADTKIMTNGEEFKNTTL